VSFSRDSPGTGRRIFGPPFEREVEVSNERARKMFRVWNTSSLSLSLSLSLCFCHLEFNQQSLTDFGIRYNPKETRKSARERLICRRDGSAIILVPPAVFCIRIACARASNRSKMYRTFCPFVSFTKGTTGKEIGFCPASISRANTRGVSQSTEG